MAYQEIKDHADLKKIMEEAQVEHAKKMARWRKMKDVELMKEIQSLLWKDDDMMDQDNLFDLQYVVDILCARYGIETIMDV